ncbi:hypothetical protein [Methylobacterium gregans]
MSASTRPVSMLPPVTKFERDEKALKRLGPRWSIVASMRSHGFTR